jgi:excinuclease UvrABC nuclease subunit
VLKLNWSNSIPFNRNSINSVPENSGIYMFTNPDIDAPVYIGETGNLRQRFQQYLNGENQCVTLFARYFRFKLEPNHLTRKKEEEDLIRRYKPKCNIEYK